MWYTFLYVAFIFFVMTSIHGHKTFPKNVHCTSYTIHQNKNVSRVKVFIIITICTYKAYKVLGSYRDISLHAIIGKTPGEKLKPTDELYPCIL